MAVPVRAELAGRLAEIAARVARASAQRIDRPRQRLRDLGRALGRPSALTEAARQRLDIWSCRLDPALRGLVRMRRQQLQARPIPAAILRGFASRKRDGLDRQAQNLRVAVERRAERRAQRVQYLGERLDVSLARIAGVTHRAIESQGKRLAELDRRLAIAPRRAIAQRREALLHLDRTRQTLGYTETLKRGFAVVHGPDGLIASAEDAAQTPQFEIQFADGRMQAQPRSATRKTKPANKPLQKSLF